MEHNEAFEKTPLNLVDQGIVQFGQYPEEKYKSILKGEAHFPLIQETFVNNGVVHGRHGEKIFS